MTRFFLALSFVFAVLCPSAPAHADQSDINAAARSVVRVVVIADDGDTVEVVGHGSGIVVAPDIILTNAHVVEPLAQDADLKLGVIPSQGETGYFARVLRYAPRTDLALLKLTEKGRLVPMTFTPVAVSDGAEVFAVGYPANVDIAQGLDFGDLISPITPVKTRGNVSGGRSAKKFETILHTAAIGGGNSGGPLLDACGRVIGVNSFGTLSDGSDSEFFFAVSVREVLKFLREADIKPRLSSSACRSLEDYDDSEAARAAAIERQRDAARRTAEGERMRAMIRAERRAQLEVMNERENGMALAALLLLLGFAGVGGTAWLIASGAKREYAIGAGAASAFLVIGSLLAWFSRPEISDIEARAEALLSDNAGAPAEGPPGETLVAGDLICTLDAERSRVTVSNGGDLAFAWSEQGCVSERTQYARTDQGEWARVLVPNEEDTVSVNRYDPETGVFRTERYLLPLSTMEKAREARGKYSAPKCEAGEDKVLELGSNQQTILDLLPARPNERLVYRCSIKP
ncbi:S1C family serine protease [Pseudoblastomonas halimionae]|uniref:Trypsin-like serine protease n=1 Tax=Alteriqipengyuania halimionae TaxID=1926630 RepID=A0A6I4TZJ3_9SPHN|nr:serine protease [Alteriqipengyuania halimionae]MXP09058.1 trypsin-like serine protease [Alteriqipengyuania halimionae]